MIDPPPGPVDSRFRISQADERARVLAAVLRDQAERAEAARRTQLRRGERHRRRRWALVGTWVAVAYVWLGNPAWIQVEPVPEATIQAESEALRVRVFLQTQQIEAYRLERGRLPWVLQEAGPPFPGMVYHRTDNRSYALEARSSRIRLDYESRDPMEEFLGSSILRIRPPGMGGVS